jgi:hypothetical protein
MSDGSRRSEEPRSPGAETSEQVMPDPAREANEERRQQSSRGGETSDALIEGRVIPMSSKKVTSTLLPATERAIYVPRHAAEQRQQAAPTFESGELRPVQHTAPYVLASSSKKT